MKLCEGDVVRVVPRTKIQTFRRLDDSGYLSGGYISPDGVYISDEALFWCEKNLTISAVSNQRNWFTVIENPWLWSEECIEPPEEKVCFDGLEGLL